MTRIVRSEGRGMEDEEAEVEEAAAGDATEGGGRRRRATGLYQKTVRRKRATGQGWRAGGGDDMRGAERAGGDLERVGRVGGERKAPVGLMNDKGGNMADAGGGSGGERARWRLV